MDILHRYTQAVLYHSDLSDVRAAIEAAVRSGADLFGAYLFGAYLYGAYLYGADLSSADLSSANLSSADLSGANLSGANLSSALGLTPERVQPLLMLNEQPGLIRAYKLVDADYRSPIQDNGKLTYPIGARIEVPSANTDITQNCAAGVNVATLDWCLNTWKPGWRVMVVEFEAKDIACIPTASDGKFRLFRCTVVAEKDITALVKQPGPAVVV